MGLTPPPPKKKRLTETKAKNHGWTENLETVVGLKWQNENWMLGSKGEVDQDKIWRAKVEEEYGCKMGRHDQESSGRQGIKNAGSVL